MLKHAGVLWSFITSPPAGLFPQHSIIHWCTSERCHGGLGGWCTSQFKEIYMCFTVVKTCIKQMDTCTWQILSCDRYIYAVVNLSLSYFTLTLADNSSRGSCTCHSSFELKYFLWLKMMDVSDELFEPMCSNRATAPQSPGFYIPSIILAPEIISLLHKTLCIYS